MFQISLRAGALATAALVLVAAPLAAEEPPFERLEERKRCKSYEQEKQPFFGDTHVHTAYSFDAASQNTRNTPREAYRFARRASAIGIQPYDAEGKAHARACRSTVRSTGPRISDHAEMLGEVRSCLHGAGHTGTSIRTPAGSSATLGPLGMIVGTPSGR